MSLRSHLALSETIFQPKICLQNETASHKPHRVYLLRGVGAVSSRLVPTHLKGPHRPGLGTGKCIMESGPRPVKRLTHTIKSISFPRTLYCCTWSLINCRSRSTFVEVSKLKNNGRRSMNIINVTELQNYHPELPSTHQPLQYVSVNVKII